MPEQRADLTQRPVDSLVAAFPLGIVAEQRPQLPGVCVGPEEHLQHLHHDRLGAGGVCEDLLVGADGLDPCRLLAQDHRIGRVLRRRPQQDRGIAVAPPLDQQASGFLDLGLLGYPRHGLQVGLDHHRLGAVGLGDGREQQRVPAQIGRHLPGQGLKLLVVTGMEQHEQQVQVQIAGLEPLAAIPVQLGRPLHVGAGSVSLAVSVVLEHDGQVLRRHRVVGLQLQRPLQRLGKLELELSSFPFFRYSIAECK